MDLAKLIQAAASSAVFEISQPDCDRRDRTLRKSGFSLAPQRRRSRGRGKQFAIGKISAVKPIQICEVCAAEGLNAVEVSRDTMANVALIS